MPEPERRQNPRSTSRLWAEARSRRSGGTTREVPPSTPSARLTALARPKFLLFGRKVPIPTLAWGRD